jgi:hypothetical protein
MDTNYSSGYKNGYLECSRKHAIKNITTVESEMYVTIPHKKSRKYATRKKFEG